MENVRELINEINIKTAEYGISLCPKDLVIIDMNSECDAFGFLNFDLNKVQNEKGLVVFLRTYVVELTKVLNEIKKDLQTFNLCTNQFEKYDMAYNYECVINRLTNVIDIVIEQILITKSSILNNCAV